MVVWIEKRTIQLVILLVFSVFPLLWIFISHPHFPVISLFDVQLPYRFPILGVLLATWLVYFNQKSFALAALFILVPFFMLFNISMLRPDVYFVCLCLLAISLSNHKKQIYMAFLLILGGMYFWTAIHKCHWDFVVNMARVFDKRILGNAFPDGFSRALAISIPVLEIALAALCFSGFRKTRIVLATILHSGILYFLIKGGWNHTMIAWNMLLIGLHFILPEFKRNELKIKGVWLLPGLFSIILPAFYFVQLMPGFASWTMYSSSIQHYRLVIDEQTALNPPKYIRDFVYQKDGVYSVSITQWADKETGGPPCMEPLFADKVLRDCERYIQTHN